MEKPKILTVAPLPPPIHGSSVVSQQIRESRVINEAFDCDYVNMATSRGMDEIGKMSLIKVFRFLNSFFTVFWKLATRKYDLCYLAITCHGSGFLKDAPFVLLCKLFRRRIIIHQHNRGMSRDLDRPVYRWLIPLVYKNAKVILLSRLLYPDIEKVVPKENVYICPNGIKQIAVSPRQYAPKGVCHLLFLSNMLVEKGVPVLLDALEKLKDGGCEFVCDLVGSDTRELPSERIHCEIENRGLSDCVFFHGKKYGEEKRKFYEVADIFVFPTYYVNETFGLVNIEAMQYGLSIVSTRVGGIPDLVNDGINGLLVEPKDSEGLAMAVEKLLNDEPLRKRMGEAGHRLYEERFTEEIFERNLCGVLKKCIQNK